MIRGRSIGFRVNWYNIHTLKLKCFYQYNLSMSKPDFSNFGHITYYKTKGAVFILIIIFVVIYIFHLKIHQHVYK